MKAIIAGILFCLCSFSLLAQTGYSIKGIVADTVSKARLSNTSVTVLNSKDSTLVKFGRTATDGSFSLNLSKGKFILLVAYPEYADYVGKFELDSVNKAHNFGQINLTLKAKLLEEVVINGTAAITIKGDTTVFNTSNLKIQPNSNVEDLLKQLPGIQVDQNGKITAQGQAVNKVLVDGEEFFGDDPTLVTKNIRASMVKSVELFDKKSDQAAFTGIDDGVKTKTLNVVLKDASKNGYFGKLDAGEAPDNYYQGQAMFNKFKTKMKFSAYGNIGNTGRTGLGFEGSRYGFSNSVVTDGSGQILPADDLESFSGRYDGHGIPLARTSGLHYDTKWNKDKETLNANYKIGSINVNGSQNNIIQNNLPLDVIINNTSDQNYNNYMFRQKLDAAYEIKLNPTSTLKISADGALINSETSNNNTAISTRGDNSLLNSSDRNLSNDGDQKSFNTSVLWTKRLKKARRTFSLNVSESFITNDSKGFLNSTNDFYNASGTTIDSTQHIDQYKTGKATSSVLGSNMTWSEPLSKTLAVVFNYGLVLRNETSERLSFGKSGTGKYDLLDQQYSNNFDLDQVTNQAGAIFNYTKSKNVLNFGTRVSAVNYDQTDLDNSIHYKRNYFNINPQASFQHRYSQQRSIFFNYRGITTQPVISQLQPVKVNDDPLNITLGNPDLKPSFRSNFGTSYSASKPLGGSSFYIQVNYSLTSNPIVSNRFTDAAGKSTIQSVNIKGKNPSTYSLFSYYNFKLKKTGILQIGPDLNFSGNTFYSYINNEINVVKSNSYSSGFSISANKVKKYNFRIVLDPRYIVNSSSLRPQFNDNTWGLSSNVFISLFLPGKVQITSDTRYTYTEKTEAFGQSISPLIWNSTISKKFFKKENLTFSVSGSDLLNQNTGFTRAAYSQSSYTTIQRYFMGSLTWDFTKPVGAAPKK